MLDLGTPDEAPRPDDEPEMINPLGEGVARSDQSPERRKGDDEILAAARAQGQTIEVAAKAAGLSERQARRRLREPDVIARVEELRSEHRAEVLGSLEQLGTNAVACLDALLKNGTPQVQLGAARTVLSVGAQLHERLEVEAQLRRIHALVAGTGNTEEPRAGGSADGWPG
jgi:hypothetical protein